MAVAALDDPQIGEFRTGAQLGKKSLRTWYVWMACEECGKPRWTFCIHRKPTSHVCVQCNCRRMRKCGSEHSSWRGGTFKDGCGYIQIKLTEDDRFFPMASKARYIRQHRLVVAQHLGRLLGKHEHVHHKNGVRDDNRIENLELVSPANHTLYKRMCNNCALRAEIRLLRRQIAELTLALQSKLGAEDGGDTWR